MKALLDAHTLIWAVDNPAQLSLPATDLLNEPANDLLLSAGSIWEISIKVGLGKLALSQPFGQWIGLAIADLALEVLPITVEHADCQSRLPRHHGDPFDRLLVAQASVEQVVIVSNDIEFDSYGIQRVW